MNPQATDEWRLSRLGKATASRLDAVCAQGRSGGPSATRADYMAELITERLTGIPSEGFVSYDMRWGIENEPAAKLAYQVETGYLVTEVGAIDHPVIPWTAASPDGLLDDPDGLLEIKCPKTKTHLAYMRAGVPPQDYIKQMAWQAACSGRTWVDFCSYDPRLPEDLQLFIVRYVPDPKIIKVLETAVIDFLAELVLQLAEIEQWRQRHA